MKASFFRTPGDFSVLEYGEQPDPIYRAGEVLIRVKACALNRIDLWQRSGKYAVTLPHIPGSDIAGILEDGREVVVNPAIPCGGCERCKKNQDCEFVSIVGFSTQGGYGELISVPMENVYAKPKGLSFVEAAAFPLTYLTAWHMLKTRAHLEKGESIFIWGATGGLGIAAIQIAKYLGAHIRAATRSSHKAEVLRTLGVDEVLLMDDKIVFQPIDVVFESVGEETWNKSIAMLKPLGRLVLAGTTSGNNASLDLQKLYAKQISILGSRMGSPSEFEEILSLMESGAFKPVISKTFPLKEASEAHHWMESAAGIGKIVLET